MTMGYGKAVTGMGQAKIGVLVFKVTPAMAARWLESNTSNRPIRQSKVDQYARDMRRGNWKPTAEPIKFAASGRLLDGQHRLWAVVESDTITEMFVAHGLDEDVQPYMDTGVARKASDNLHMRGEAVPQVLAAAARIGFLVDEKLMFRNRTTQRASHADIYQWIEDNPAIRRSAGYVTTGEVRKVELSPSVKAYCHFRFSALDPDHADLFFSTLGSLINVPAGSPIHALSTRLRNLDRKRVRIELPDALSVTFRAWNAWRTNKTLAKIPLIPAGGTHTLPALL